MKLNGNGSRPKGVSLQIGDSGPPNMFKIETGVPINEPDIFHETLRRMVPGDSFTVRMGHDQGEELGQLLHRASVRVNQERAQNWQRRKNFEGSILTEYRWQPKLQLWRVHLVDKLTNDINPDEVSATSFDMTKGG